MAEKTCFVIAPIGDPESDTRKRSDEILEYVITPAVIPCGYQPIRADKISEQGIITSQVIERVVNAPLVIADLTGHNPNVFYELAIRHAIRKPFVQLIEAGEKIPFDVAATRVIHVDHHNLGSAAECKAEIVRQVKSLEADPTKLATPISDALDLQLLRRSDDPVRQSLGDILTAISELRSSTSSIESRLSGSRFEQALWELVESARFLVHRADPEVARQMELHRLRISGQPMAAIMREKIYSMIKEGLSDEDMVKGVTWNVPPGYIQEERERYRRSVEGRATAK